MAPARSSSASKTAFLVRAVLGLPLLLLGSYYTVTIFLSGIELLLARSQGGEHDSNFPLEFLHFAFGSMALVIAITGFALLRGLWPSENPKDPAAH
ncbi:MAG: hypothetical protein P1V81_14440 [Planctomycetota bacterium]|nr:hypothetical protein [Planctomycetota bacterium]